MKIIKRKCVVRQTMMFFKFRKIFVLSRSIRARWTAGPRTPGGAGSAASSCSACLRCVLSWIRYHALTVCLFLGLPRDGGQDGAVFQEPLGLCGRPHYYVRGQGALRPGSKTILIFSTTRVYPPSLFATQDRTACDWWFLFSGMVYRYVRIRNLPLKPVHRLSHAKNRPRHGLWR